MCQRHGLGVEAPLEVRLVLIVPLGDGGVASSTNTAVDVHGLVGVTEDDVVPAIASIFEADLSVGLIKLLFEGALSIIVLSVSVLVKDEVSIEFGAKVEVSLVVGGLDEPAHVLLIRLIGKGNIGPCDGLATMDVGDTGDLAFDVDTLLMVNRGKSPQVRSLVLLGPLDAFRIAGMVMAAIDVENLARVAELDPEPSIAGVLEGNLGVALVADTRHGDSAAIIVVATVLVQTVVMVDFAADVVVSIVRSMLDEPMKVLLITFVRHGHFGIVLNSATMHVGAAAVLVLEVQAGLAVNEVSGVVVKGHDCQ
jgi:hypothetical protein